MQKISRNSFAGLLAAILATACFGFASWGSHKSKDRSTDVTFADKTRFNNGDTLQPGTYRMEVAENSQSPKVTFSRDGKVIATVPAKLVSEANKNPDTEVDSVKQGDEQLVMKIRPKGWNESLEFGSAVQ